MGEVTFHRELRDGQDLLFAYLPSGEPVWGMDLGARSEWWYLPERSAEVSPAIRSAIDALADVPPAREPAPPSGPGVDLATHQPGHAVLARIAEIHQQASSAVVEGMPGTLDQEVTSWCVGYVGEEKVAAALASLGDGWRVLHGVPVGERGADVDHLVIGPPGVFTINTKHHPGVSVDVKGDAVFVAGDFQRYVAAARLEAQRATAAGDDPALTAYGVLAFVGARLRVKEAPTGVVALDAIQLVPWLQGLPPRLSPGKVDAAYQRLRWSGNWTQLPPPEAAPSWVADFARHIAAERAVVRQQQRGRRRTTRAAGSARSASGAARNRSGARRTTRKSSMSGILLRLLAAIVALLMAPILLSWFINGITSGIKAPKSSSKPSATTQAPVAVPGASCPVAGAQAISAGGRTYVCAPSPASGKLTWRRA